MRRDLQAGGRRPAAAAAAHSAADPAARQRQHPTTAPPPHTPSISRRFLGWCALVDSHPVISGFGISFGTSSSSAAIPHGVAAATLLRQAGRQAVAGQARGGGSAESRVQLGGWAGVAALKRRNVCRANVLGSGVLLPKS